MTKVVGEGADIFVAVDGFVHPRNVSARGLITGQKRCGKLVRMRGGVKWVDGSAKENRRHGVEKSRAREGEEKERRGGRVQESAKVSKHNGWI